MYKHKLFSSYEELIEFLNDRKIKKENIIHISIERMDYYDWIDLVYKVEELPDIEGPAERGSRLDYLQSVIDEINIWMGN